MPRLSKAFAVHLKSVTECGIMKVMNCFFNKKWEINFMFCFCSYANHIGCHANWLGDERQQIFESRRLWHWRRRVLSSVRWLPAADLVQRYKLPALSFLLEAWY